MFNINMRGWIFVVSWSGELVNQGAKHNVAQGPHKSRNVPELIASESLGIKNLLVMKCESWWKPTRCVNLRCSRLKYPASEF